MEQHPPILEDIYEPTFVIILVITMKHCPIWRTTTSPIHFFSTSVGAKCWETISIQNASTVVTTQQRVVLHYKLRGLNSSGMHQGRCVGSAAIFLKTTSICYGRNDPKASLYNTLVEKKIKYYYAHHKLKHNDDE